MALYHPDEISRLDTRIIRKPDGGWTLIADWDGKHDPNAIYFGTGEAMSLTEEEREARDTMIASLDADGRAQCISIGKDSERRVQKSKQTVINRIWLLFAATGWGLLGLVYAFGPLG